jgi:RNA polymerase sigma-70 factor (family 1)
MNRTIVNNEAELIRELKDGSRAAFDEIYAMYSKRLYGYCLKLSKDKETAEDIVQDVFLRLWIMRADIRQEDTLRSLLFIISKNYLIKSSYDKIHSQVFEDYVTYQDELRNDSSADTHLEYDDYISMIRQKMQMLPQTQRKVIELSRLEQYSIEEVAQQLSLSEQTVRNQLSLGLKTLRGLVGDMPLLVLFILKYLSE